MTKTSLDKKFREIAKKVPAMLREFKRAALASKAFDLSAETDDFILPKAILAAALLDAADQWKPKTADPKFIQTLTLQTYADYSQI